MRSRFAPKGLSTLVVLIGFATAPALLAQNTSGMFLTPVAGAPFTGVILVNRTIPPAAGRPAVELRNVRDVARDAQGRVYNVFRQPVPASFSGEPPTIRIHLYDPATRSYAFLYPQHKTYQTGTVNHPPAAEPADLMASPTGAGMPLSQFAKLQDLGTQSVNGIAAHGVRETQTVSAAWGASGGEVVLIDEYWYSDDLHMNVKIVHNDPRTGTVMMTMTNVSRGDPDPSLFQIPDGYQAMQRGIPNGAPPAR